MEMLITLATIYQIDGGMLCLSTTLLCTIVFLQLLGIESFYESYFYNGKKR